MIEPFLKVAELLAAWPEIPSGCQNEQSLGDASCDRLRRALMQLRDKGPFSPGPGDLASLVYHVARRAHLLTGSPVPFRVPHGQSWPTAEAWSQLQVRLSQWANGWEISDALPWSPSWLEGSQKYPPFDDAIAEVKYAFAQPHLPLDPCLEKQLGSSSDIKEYLSPGQAQAVRAVCLAEQGTTTMVVLPTGSGKTLVVYAAALCDPTEAGLTVVITPTVALALDQERRWNELLSKKGEPCDQPCSWHAGTSETSRFAILDAIREGRQRVLFTSPEAVVTFLSGPLARAAEMGFLRNIVIDEAHMVAQWGDDFRPEFQSISATRRHFLRVAPTGSQPRTVLMTATLVDESLDTLRNLFTEEGRWSLVGAIHLRPEPRYWMARAPDSAQREYHLLEAIRHAPRCLILYVTKVDHALNWHARLRRAGFTRVALFTGRTSDEEREQILLDWGKGNWDIVVATSAFGLGVDKSDIRCVLHSCIPETLDRYYQEVGRGGRDGSACASILVSEPDDLGVAKSLSSPTLIGPEKGFIRWNTMRLSAERSSIGQNTYKFDLKLVPATLTGENETNRAWNLKTLLLMARAGMVRLDLEPWRQPEPKSGESAEHFRVRVAEARRNFADQIVVEFLAGGFTTQQEWDLPVAEARNRTYQSRSASLKSLVQLLNGQSAHEQKLSAIYSLPDYGLIAASLCAGCAACRQRQAPALGAANPVPTTSAVVRSKLNDSRLIYLIPANGLLLVEYPANTPSSTWMAQIAEFLQRVVSFGISEVVVPSAWRNGDGKQVGWDRLHTHSDQGFVVVTDPGHLSLFGQPLPLPRLRIIPPLHDKRRFPQAALELHPADQIVVFPDNLIDPSQPGRPFAQVAQSRSLAETLSRLKA